MSANRISKFSLSASLSLALGLGACAPVPDLGSKPVPRGAASVGADRSFALAGEAGGQALWPDERWWTGYGDAQLNALIDEGLNHSPDMAAAAARFRKATGYAQQAGAPLLPSVDVGGSATMNKTSRNIYGDVPAFKSILPSGWKDTGDLSLNLGFDLDIWGRNRAALAAATSDAKAAHYDARQARLTLSTAIADAYTDLARLYEERDIQQEMLKVRLASQDLVAQRQANGLETRGSLKQADATVSTARASLAAAQEAIALRSNQIAALVGAGPDRGLDITRPKLSFPAGSAFPADATTNLLIRRPDVAASLARVEAAASRIKVARADFFPAISLSGMIGYQALGLDLLLKKDSVKGAVGPAISLPIFHGGALSGQYRSERAGYDEAVADYDKAVLTAYQQVADAVTSRSMLNRRLVDARAALDASRQALAIARMRYEGGLSTYLDVLNVEDRFLSARQAVAEMSARAFTLDIALVRSLGGGFLTSDMPNPKDDTNG